MKTRNFILKGHGMPFSKYAELLVEAIQKQFRESLAMPCLPLKTISLLAFLLFFTSNTVISQSSTPFAEVTSISHSCNGFGGSVEFTLLGDPASFEYYWTHGPTDLTLTDLEPGFYTLVVMNFLGCVESYTIEILDLSECIMKVEIVPTDDPCISYIVLTVYGIDGELVPEEGVEVTWEDGTIPTGLKREIFTGVDGEYCVTVSLTGPEECCKMEECISITGMPCFQLCEEELIVNEVNRNSDGRGQYIELMVLGKCECGRMIDLRGFILDDNNGYLIQGNEFVNYFNLEESIGANPGYISFSSNPVWAAVPNGSLILIYDEDDGSIPNFPVDDPTDADGDGVYVLQASNPNYFNAKSGNWNENEKTVEYGGLLVSPDWEKVNINNQADGVQVRNSNGDFHHGISFGATVFSEPNIFPLWMSAIPNSNRNCQLINSDYSSVSGYDCYEFESLLHSPGMINSIGNEELRNSVKDCDSIPSLLVQSLGSNPNVDLKIQKSFTQNEELSVFPNPFTNQVNIEYKSSLAGKSMLRLMDLSGKLILSKEIDTILGANLYELHSDNSLPTGVLILEFTFPSGFKMNHRLTYYQLD